MINVDLNWWKTLMSSWKFCKKKKENVTKWYMAMKIQTVVSFFIVPDNLKEQKKNFQSSELLNEN